MSKSKLYALTTCAILCFSIMQAQNDSITDKANRYVYNSLMDLNFKNARSAETVDRKPDQELNYSGRWIIGAGINMIEDSGHQKFGDFFTFKHKNLGNPFMVSTEYITSNRFSFGVTILFNKYQSGKNVQGLIIQDASEPGYFAIDFGAKYILSKQKFTPYVIAGTGYRYIGNYEAANLSGILIEVPKTRDITLNTGLGANYWINENWGLTASYIAKFAMKAGANKNYKTNHLVSSFGVLYRFNNKYFE